MIKFIKVLLKVMTQLDLLQRILEVLECIQKHTCVTVTTQKVGFEFTEPSLTKQAEKDEADINNIIGKFMKTGQVTSFPTGKPQFGDFTEVGDYQRAMQSIIEAQEMFDDLPSDIRKRFDNDPKEFTDFCLDPANHEEMQKLGLISPPSVSKENQTQEADSAE